MEPVDLTERGLTDDQLSPAFVALLSVSGSKHPVKLDDKVLNLLARARPGDVYEWVGRVFERLDNEVSRQGIIAGFSFSGFLDFLARGIVGTEDIANVGDLLQRKPLSYKLSRNHVMTLSLLAELGPPPLSLVENLVALELADEEIGGLEHAYIESLYNLKGADQPALNRLAVSRGYGFCQPLLTDLQLANEESPQTNGTTHIAPVDVPRESGFLFKAGEAGGLDRDEDAIVAGPYLANT